MLFSRIQINYLLKFSIENFNYTTNLTVQRMIFTFRIVRRRISPAFSFCHYFLLPKQASLNTPLSSNLNSSSITDCIEITSSYLCANYSLKCPSKLHNLFIMWWWWSLFWAMFALERFVENDKSSVVQPLYSQVLYCR